MSNSDGSDHLPAPMAQETRLSRRWFLLRTSAFLNGIVGTILLIPITRYLLSPARRTSGYRGWVSLGHVNQFPIGQTRLAKYENPFRRPWDGETASIACYVRRLREDKFQVFAINCAHLGCPVRWFPQSELFMCPCHGGAYYADGSRASGPPERGLFTYEYRILGPELHIDAGQMPTVSNSAVLATPGECERNGSRNSNRLVKIDEQKGTA